MEAAFDKAFYDTPVQKSPNYVTGELGYWRGKGDKYAMKKIGSFLNTDKNLQSWIIGTLVDDAVSLIQAGVTTKSKNSGSDEKYFPKDKCTGEKYGTYSFTTYDDKKEMPARMTSTALNDMPRSSNLSGKPVITWPL